MKTLIQLRQTKEQHTFSTNFGKLQILTMLILLTAVFITNCSTPSKEYTVETDENGVAILSDEEVENVVRRSYQYVAMYNVNNKFALAEEGLTTRGYNKGIKNTNLFDHSVQSIARPNNDVLYQAAMLDLRKDAAIFEFPAFESKYVSLMASGYDHYVTIPLSTTKGDFREPIKILFYTERTENYNGESIEGIDHIFEMTGDFVSLTLRVMPHASEQEKFDRIVKQINGIKGYSLSEYLGKEKLEDDPITFPPYGKTDADIYENNFLEVMQFVFNHTTFDADDELDRKALKAFEKFGIKPGKNYDEKSAVKIDGKHFRKVSLKVKDEELAKMNNPEMIARLLPNVFKPKGEMTFEALVFQSVVGPIGQPMTEAMYPPVVSADGVPMNAQNDYVIRMTKEQLPPANSFWSLTLYDTENGFFIPNDYKKYSVGENAGMKLDDEGGIEVYVSAEKPDGVPLENWLPINRKDQGIDIILRVYAPDLEGMKTWAAPKAERIN